MSKLESLAGYFNIPLRYIKHVGGDVYYIEGEEYIVLEIEGTHIVEFKYVIFPKEVTP